MNMPPAPMSAAPAAASGSGREFLTKKEVAERLGRTPRCIELWMRRGLLPYIKISRSVYFRWPDVVEALQRFRMN